MWNPFTNEFEERESGGGALHRFYKSRTQRKPTRTTEMGLTLAAGTLAGSRASSTDFSTAGAAGGNMTLNFREFVFMMNSDLLAVAGIDDWRVHAERMNKLRNAYDAMDVDGDDRMSKEELQMVRSRGAMGAAAGSGQQQQWAARQRPASGTAELACTSPAAGVLRV